MKRLLIAVLFTALGSQGFTQAKVCEIIEQMNQLASMEKSDSKNLFQFNKESGSLIYNGLQIPVTGDVLIATKKASKSKKVEFFFQKGNAVSRLDDPSWRRAYFEWPSMTKNDARLFIQLYQELHSLM